MASIQTRKSPKIGPSDTSDGPADLPQEADTDTDAEGTGERVSVGPDSHSELHNEHGADRVVDSSEAGLGDGLDEAEEAQLGVTDEELAAREARKRARR